MGKTITIDPWKNAPPGGWGPAPGMFDSRSAYVPNGVPTFRNVDDWLAYNQRTDIPSDARSSQFAAVKANPNAYEITASGGIDKKPSGLVKALPWLALGAMAIPAGGFGGAAALGPSAAGTTSVATGAGAVPASLAASGAAAGAHGMTLGNLLTSNLFGQIPGAVGNIFAARSQGKSADTAARLQSEATAAALQQAREQMAQQAAQFAAQQQQARTEFDAAQEQRTFDRTQAEYQRKLIEDREARLNPYRKFQAQTLAQLLTGGRSPFASPITSPFYGAK